MGRTRNINNKGIINVILNVLFEEAEEREVGRNIYKRKTILQRRRALSSISFQKARQIPKINSFLKTIHRCDDSTFQSHFRILENDLEPLLKVGARRPKVPIRKTLLMTLWTLGNKDSFRQISVMFIVSRGTAFSTVLSTCKAISSLTTKYVRWPQTVADLGKVVNKFNNLRGAESFPDVIGCVDGTHIEIPSPVVNAASYYNRKGFQSLKLQAIYDSEMRFTNISFGWPGRSHDACMWESSEIGKQLNSGILEIPGRYHLLGDSAYSIRKYLMAPYRDNGHLSRSQINFNRKLSSSRIVIEQAFCLLKGRFLRLKYLNVRNLSHAKYLVLSSAIIHNLIINTSNDIENRDMINRSDESLKENDPEPAFENEFRTTQYNVGKEKRDFLRTMVMS